MKTYLLSILAILATPLLLSGQDCFMPPDGYTLYTTTDLKYNPPAQSGFITLTDMFLGEWSVVNTAPTATAVFSDNMGRTSTIAITGTGPITIESEITQLPATPVDTCQQTFFLEEYIPVVAQNPVYSKGCPLKIVLVIDESNSMSDMMSSQTIRDAVSAFANNLQDTDNQLALVEFESTAERISLNGSTALQTVDASLVNAIDLYLDNDYNPIGNSFLLIGGTNWEDALLKADQVVGADIIIVLTDSKPTFFNTSMGMNGIGGEGQILDMTALKEAVDVANEIKKSGKRMFVISTDLGNNVQPVIDISGDIEYRLGDVGNRDILRTDYTKASEETLIAIMSQIGTTCQPVTVPTMGEWSIVCVSLLLLIFGCVHIKNQNESICLNESL